MSAGLERLKQRDAQQKQHATPSETEVLTSILTTVEAQNSRIASLAEQRKRLASYVKVMDEESGKQIEQTERRLRELITQAYARTPSDSGTNESVRAELHDIGQTLSLLASALDGKQVTEAVSALASATTQIEKTTAWNSEQAEEFVKKYRQALNSAGQAINSTRDKAAAAIKESASAAAGTAAARVDSPLESVQIATDTAERIVGVAERIEERLGWSAAARLALSLLPVCVVLLMGVQSLWTVVVGIRWALAQDWALWLNITAGIALAGLVAGAGMGLWRLTVWVRCVLEDAAMDRRRSTS